MGENGIMLNTIFHLLNFEPIKYITYWQKRKKKKKEKMEYKESSELISAISRLQILTCCGSL